MATVKRLSTLLSLKYWPALRFRSFVTFQRGVRRPAEIQAVTQASSPSPGQTGFADTEVVLFDTEFYELFVNSGG